MRRKRKNKKREKMIMLCSSVLVLTALTMTGVYVKDKKQEDNDGYVVDLSRLEPEPAEMYETEKKEGEDSAEAASSKVKNSENLPEDENYYEMPWDYSFMEKKEEYVQDDILDFLEPEEEEFHFSEEDALVWPIVGNILINYSMEKPVYFSTLDQYKCSPAIIIQAKEGQNVMAAAKGRVSKVEKTEELGNVITVDAGDEYEIIYGQLTNIQVKEGDMVNQGDYLADVAAPTKYYSVEGCNIYFALKKEGKPLNPMTQLQ